VLPLLKHKHGDATDINMYRGIAISPVISKVFQLISLQLYELFLITHSLQYGFKKGNSCNRALFTVNVSIRYFTNRGSRVYCAFLDATEAFDKVLHNGICKTSPRKKRWCKLYSSFTELVWSLAV